MDDITGGAYIENFRQFLREHIQAGKESIEDFYGTLEAGSGTADALSNYSSPPPYTGIAYWIDSQLPGWRNIYGDGVVGEAIKEIENDFPELSDPHFYYWTKNFDVHEEIANLYDRIEAALIEAMQRIQNVLDAKKAEAEARDAQEAEMREERKRAREQAERAREIELKYTEKNEQPEARTSLGQIFRETLRGMASVRFASSKSGMSSIRSATSKIAKAITNLFRRGK